MQLNIESPENSFRKLDFSVLKLVNKAPDFILNLSTNTLEGSQNAFLDINGKIVAFAFQKIVGDSVYLLVRKPYDLALENHLQKYLLIGPTKLERIETKVYHIFCDERLGEFTISLPLGYLSWGLNEERLQSFSQINDDDYLLIRIASKIPFQGIEYENPMMLEINQDEALSQNKGCYLGQEIIARVLSRGKIPRSLQRFAFKEKPRQIISNSEKAGEIKSMTFSPRHNLWVVFAMIDKDLERIDGGEILD